MKFIYLDQDEEITSVIDRLNQEEAEEINLVVPIGAQLWQNLINLKLLKREADGLNKTIILVTSDELGREMGQRAGLVVKKEKDFPIDLIRQAEEKAEEKSDNIKINRGNNNEDEDEDSNLAEDLEQDDLLDEQLKEGPKQLIEGPKKDRNIFDVLTKDLEAEKSMGNEELFRLAASSIKKPKRKKVADITFSDLKLKKPINRLKAKFLRTKPKTSIKIFRAEKKAVPETKSSLFRKLFFVFIGLAVLMAGVVTYFILPNVEIIITPKTELTTLNLLVTGSKDISQIDSGTNKIPIQLIKAGKTEKGEFPATGQKNLNEKASGIITVYNEYSSSLQTLVATTRFESTDGKVFRLTKTLTIPGAKIEEGQIIPSSVDVEVVADQPGQDYNIGPAEFTIPGFKGTAKYVGFYGRSKAPMTGGLIGNVKVVSADDLRKAEEILTSELKEKAGEALNEQIPTNLTPVEKGTNIEIIKTVFSAKQGDVVDNFNLEITALAQTALYNQDNLKELINLKLNSQIGGDKELLPQTQEIDFKEVNIDWPNSQVNLSLSIQEKVAWRIDISSIKQDLAGKNETEVRRYLTTRPEIEKAKISFRPFWVKQVPRQDKKIKITIDSALQNL